MAGRIKTWWATRASRRYVLAPPFEACFRCGYSLVGHGVPLRCPECGTEHDEATRAWIREYGIFDGTPELKRCYGVSFIIIFSLQITVGTPSLFAPARHWFQSVAGVIVYSILALNFALFVWSTVRWSRSRPRWYFAIAPEGLVLSGLGTGRGVVRPWAFVRRNSSAQGTDYLVKMHVCNSKSSPEERAPYVAAIDARLALLRGPEAAAEPPSEAGWSGAAWPELTTGSWFWDDRNVS